MNLFTAIGALTNTVTNTLVKALGVVDKLVESCDHVADMANSTTITMRDDMVAENQANSAKLRESLKSKATTNAN